MEDTDDLWEEEFKSLTLKLVQVMADEGKPRWLEPTNTVLSFFSRLVPKPSPSAELVWDEVSECIRNEGNFTLAFGERPESLLVMDGGHTIWFVETSTPSEMWGFQIADRISGGLVVHRRQIDWSRHPRPSGG
jgi:hypothetical protein